MARPSTADQRRSKLLPHVATTFARLGYRRATTADLARACAVPENTLFRLWGDKKGMFLAALNHLYANTVAIWQRRLAAGGDGSPAEVLLAYEGEHYGERGLYRVVFTGLAEIDDAEIRRALRTLYRRFHRFVCDCIARHRGAADTDTGVDADSARIAWTVIGMATVAGIGRELRVITRRQQRELFQRVGRALLDL